MLFNRKTLLKYIVLFLLGFGLVMSFLPFVKSMNPPKNSIDKWQVEIAASNLDYGELKKFDNEIWVYRRTPEQIEWLETYEPVKTQPYILERSWSEKFDGNFRSKDKEFFVFKTWESRGRVFVREHGNWVFCGDLIYHGGAIELSNGLVYEGVISCSFGRQSINFENHRFTYDVAGISSNEYIMPLAVPYYEINRKGNIVVGPKP
ncbi:hypothetical protein [Oleiphilus sp. HI0066]|uniref:hypothetical protein n=2 Tax=unclassified Oleiphilus TaxID=2631174 RepID=UPI0007C24BF7|nr:hypothetical protein [Oleiphilus sp. HI0066]KZY64365.1 hypothetical protein A3738_19320 [Oleiphilus sp. HI0066]KZY64854.1 hypothetical protein A3738_09705 [Oleiphilus sp. HI0066]KZY71509.1 hypothetical protein A3739_04730 [Oleiphilus sp. HI0067]